MKTTVEPRIDAAGILHPRSVAVIGASEDVGKFGGRVMHYLTRHRFEGRIVPVNKSRETIFGVACVRRIGDAPAVDVALLALPPKHLVAAVGECAEAGVKACVIMTTGFAEAGAEGARMQEELLDIVRGTGMRIVGPNCMGLMSPHHQMALTSSLVLENTPLRKGTIGLISQSGALMVSIYNRADDAGIGFSACVSLGNQADLEICDFLEYLIDDPRTSAVCIYMEGLRDPRRFLAAAGRARAAGKPVLLVKTGRTEAGVKSARSHTASLAGAYDVFAAACTAEGVVLLDDPDSMVQLADFLTRWPQVAGDGVGVVSSSGGGAGIAVDRLSEAGIRLAQLEVGTRARLGEFLLPPQADNPIDLGGRTVDDPFEGARRSVETMAGDPDVSVLLIVLTTVPFYAKTTEVMARAAIAAGKPYLVLVTPGSAANGPRAILRELGCPCYERFDDGMRLLRGLRDYRATRRVPGAVVRPPDLAPPTGLRLPDAAGQLTEPETKTLLASYGIAVTREQVCATADEAARVAASYGFPVVLKAVARGLIHKSDIGGVHLGLRTESEVRQAFAAIESAVATRATDARFEGCLVQEQVEPGSELILGIKRDEVFGPVVVAGAGGVLVELVKDVAMALAPAGRDQARAMLERLSIWPLLNGYRGRPALDVDAAADALARLSWLAADLGDRLEALDINPLAVRPRGRGVVALDARATVSEACPQPRSSRAGRVPGRQGPAAAGQLP
jgi:acetyl-CoA synthetase (ADP-forming)